MHSDPETEPTPGHSDAVRRIEALLLMSRWLLAPFYLGLALALLMLLLKFFQLLFIALPRVLVIPEKNLILEVLTLVDIALVANLILMVAFVGYHQFVSSLGQATWPNRKPTWLTSTDYHGLKLKAMGSVAVIAAIELLRVFLNVEDYDPMDVSLQILILLAVGFTGLLLAAMDRLVQNSHDD